MDLFLTNDPNLVLHTKVTDTKISDHRLVEIVTTVDEAYNPAKFSTPQTKHTFRNLNLHKADYGKINEHLESVNWSDLHSSCTPEDFPELLRLTVLQIMELHCPLKNNFLHRKSTNPKRRVLKRRKKKLKARIKSITETRPDSPVLERLQTELATIHNQIKDSITQQKNLEEEKAVKTIVDNPRYFYSYAKKAAKAKSRIGPLFDALGKLQKDPKTMANLLQDQYAAVFSDPQNEAKKVPSPPVAETPVIEDVDFAQEDVEKAIDEIKEHSACGEEDVPAIVLKRCKQTLSYPIFLILKHSMNTSIIPSAYKNQTITPVHKKKSKAIPENYRPISLTSHIIKILERIIRNKLVAQLESNNLLCNDQHGFRKGRSCLTQLLAHIDAILLNALEGSDTDVIYLDYQKAFDKVDHEILLMKLKLHGINGNLYNWLEEYLKDREQVVVVQGAQSYPTHVKSGVPQGTVLGPILFLLYINDLQDCIVNSTLSCFADDSRIKKKIATVEDINDLQSDLGKVERWSAENNMSLHDKKFELLCHSTQQPNLLSELPFYQQYFQYETTNGVEINPQTAVRDLGVNITPDISFSPHINSITESAKKMSAWVLSVFHDRSEPTMLTLYKSLVRSRVEYNSPLWNTNKITDIQTLENLQRSFTSKIDSCKDLNYHERLEKLKLMSLQRRRERYTIIHMYKILHNISPNDFNVNFQYSDRRGIQAVIPPLQRRAPKKAQHKYDDSFAVLGPRLWNVLPKSTTLQQTLSSFKSSLQKLLDAIPDKPPTRGYSVANSNSLLHWRGHVPGGRLNSARWPQ